MRRHTSLGSGADCLQARLRGLRWSRSRRRARCRDGGLDFSARRHLQPCALAEHLRAVAAIVRRVAGADVELQAAFEGTAAADQFMEDRRADLHVGDGIKRRQVTAVFREALRVDAGHDLHEALRAHGTCRERVQSGLDRHHRKDQQRVELLVLADLERVGDEHSRRPVRDAIAPSQVLDDELLPWVRSRRPRRRLLRGLVLDFRRLRIGSRDERHGRRKQISQLAACLVIADNRRYCEKSRASGQRDDQSSGRHGAVAHVAHEVHPCKAGGPRDPQRIIRGL